MVSCKQTRTAFWITFSELSLCSGFVVWAKVAEINANLRWFEDASRVEIVIGTNLFRQSLWNIQIKWLLQDDITYLLSLGRRNDLIIINLIILTLLNRNDILINALLAGRVVMQGLVWGRVGALGMVRWDSLGLRLHSNICL